MDSQLLWAGGVRGSIAFGAIEWISHFRRKNERISTMRLTPIIIVGIALIVLGAVAFAYQGITYTSREKVVDIGPLQASVDTKKTIPLPRILGGLVLVGGIALVVVGIKQSS
jgi:uncharacterized membrane protein